ncbi:hypothetical protein Vretifemale_8979 [Volvox reticuliferus]|uniref:Major facilitator superfamily (MFS) profile domain-containing protein n=1 Tax=Volvox reticuliferus TaxID=1737510 RepID=A0A8J4CGH3_9CHLO|nr:hypothetical protein Vretifemale_8979 [Volvox reticuliferus]
MALNKSTKGDVANTLAQGNVQIEVTTPWHPYPDKFWRISKAEYPGSGVDNDPYIVDFLDDDAANPQLWPSLYKWALTLFVSIATLAVGFCSSAYAGAAGGIMTFFGTSPEVTTLGISLFVLGFALGPLIWAPLSEVAGRRPLLIYTYMALTAFNVGTALAPNMAALIVLRFFSGAFGSSPLTNAGGIIADMFTAEQRGLAMSLFAAAPFMGPVIGPIVGGFTGESIGWRRAAKLSKVNSKVYRSKYDGTVDIHLGQLLKPTPSSDPSLARCSLSSLPRCMIASAFTGRRPCQPSWRWRACRSLCCFGGTAPMFGRGVNIRPRRPNS